MRHLHLDMPSGIAGDMLLAALIACGADLERIRHGLTSLNLGHVGVTAAPVLVGGLAATRVDVDADQRALWRGSVSLKHATPVTGVVLPATKLPAPGDDHPHRPYHLIRSLLERAALPERVRSRAQRVFRVLAEAEAAVHGCDVDTVEFHEVGALDAIVDVVGCCLALEDLQVDVVTAGPLTPGSGTVRCAHGLMPVPVPAVAQMLRRFQAPWRQVDRDTGELTTPTGAALVLGLSTADAAPRGPLRLVATGFGAGHKTIPGLVNAVRAMLSEPAPAEHLVSDTVCELTTNLDDISGEDLGAALTMLMEAGALDACASPLVMKKGRPGWQLTVLAQPADQERLAALVLTLTPAIGLRLAERQRRLLPRTAATVQVEGHSLGLKVVTLPDGSTRAKPEADDVARVAIALGRTGAWVRAAALGAWR